MHLGLQLPYFTWPGGAAEIGSQLGTIVQTAEGAGFSSIWVMDHFFQMGTAEKEMLESYSTLSYIAGKTERVKLGALVTGIIYRYPGILVKTATTLDVLSGGRAYFGVGAAWYEREAKGLGIPFPPVKVRFEQLEEVLQIAQQMWSGKTAPYNGKHYQLAEALALPQPVSKPHPPIMIGGMGEQKTMRMVAQYADACNLFTHGGTAVVQQKLEALKRHCEALGRPYEAIEKTSLGTVDLSKTTVGETITYFRELANLGITHAIVNMPNAHEIKPLEVFAKEIIPAVAEF
jgi:F420-dependent oxidoreductase-like protein